MVKTLILAGTWQQALRVTKANQFSYRDAAVVLSLSDVRGRAGSEERIITDDFIDNPEAAEILDYLHMCEGTSR